MTSATARLGWAMRRAVEGHGNGTAAFLASGSLSHRFAQNGLGPDYAARVGSPFPDRRNHQGLPMWQYAE